MQLHREGRATVTIFITLTIVALLLAYLSNVLFAIMAIVLALLLIFVAYFFRTSRRHASHDALTISSPCDGTVVTVERVREPEIFENRERLQISVFMSVWNVHMNWYPCSGTVSYSRHHKGKYLVAWLPKSSTENERSSVVITHASGERILIRQVAGAVARRIVTYASEGRDVTGGQELGFIKFGSRVDVYLPLDAEVLVNVGDRVRGVETALARLR